MPEIKVKVYECNCQLTFSADEHEDIECCPKCKSEDITCVGKGNIYGIVEH